MMKVNKQIFLFVFACITLFSTSAFALKHNYDPALLADMKNNPSNYIALGGVGSGVSTYLVKSSVNVHKYDPPNYIIAFRRVNVHHHPDGNGNWVDDAEYMWTERYYYNLDDKKMYIESNSKGKPTWEYLEAKLESSVMPTGGEIAFHLAYNMYFYGEPVTHFAREHKKTGRWIDFSNRK